MLQFEAPGEFIEKLEVNYRRDERIMRFLTFKLDKYAYEYSIKRKGNLKETKEGEISYGTESIRNQIFDPTFS